MHKINTVLAKCMFPFSAWKQCVGNHDADGCLPTCHFSLPQPKITLCPPVSFKSILQEYTITNHAKEKKKKKAAFWLLLIDITESALRIAHRMQVFNNEALGSSASETGLYRKQGL